MGNGPALHRAQHKHAAHSTAQAGVKAHEGLLRGLDTGAKQSSHTRLTYVGLSYRAISLPYVCTHPLGPSTKSSKLVGSSVRHEASTRVRSKGRPWARPLRPLRESCSAHKPVPFCDTRGISWEHPKMGWQRISCNMLGKKCV